MNLQDLRFNALKHSLQTCKYTVDDCVQKKTWYDVACKVLYRQLKSLARNIKTNSHNIILVHTYHKLRKKYVKLLSKKFEFQRSILQKLDNLQSNDPQAFWKIYEELCAKKIYITSPISPQKWWNHFLSLMNGIFLIVIKTLKIP